MTHASSGKVRGLGGEAGQAGGRGGGAAGCGATTHEAQQVLCRGSLLRCEGGCWPWLPGGHLLAALWLVGAVLHMERGGAEHCSSPPAPLPHHLQVRDGVLGSNRAELSARARAALQQRWTDYMLPRTGGGWGGRCRRWCRRGALAGRINSRVALALFFTSNHSRKACAGKHVPLLWLPSKR